MMDHLVDHLEPPKITETGLAAGTASPPPTALASKAKRPWVPVRSLTTRHRDRIRTHLLALDEHARYLRFGYAASDAQLSHYADALDFERDEVFGIFNRRLQLIGLAHLAYATSAQVSGKPPMAEFGVSVLPESRGRGLGSRLFDHAILHARNRHIETLFVYALSENAAMLKIARNAGARVERAGSESEAWLSLPPDDLASQLGAVLEDQAAELDYSFKANAKRVCQFIDAIADVKTTTSPSARSGHEERQI